MELDKFIDALGTPEEWSEVPTEKVSIDTTPDTNSRNIIGSVVTKQELEQALDLLKQD